MVGGGYPTSLGQWWAVPTLLTWPMVGGGCPTLLGQWWAVPTLLHFPAVGVGGGGLEAGVAEAVLGGEGLLIGAGRVVVEGELQVGGGQGLALIARQASHFRFIRLDSALPSPRSHRFPSALRHTRNSQAL